MSNLLNRSQKIIAYVLIVVIIFTAGVVTGRFVQKREQTVVAAETVEIHTETQDELLITNGEETVLSENEISENELETQGMPVIESTSISDNQMALISGNSTSNGKLVLNSNYQDTSEKKTLKERELIRSSYEETLAISQQDKAIIESSTLDFSNMTMAFLGDSITEGLKGTTPYPYQLKEMLGVKEVYNFGQGGSTVATIDGSKAMTERVNEIPSDVDIIVVMGGTNDNFYQPVYQFGFMTWETKGEGTFCGELQLLMKKFKWSYPNAKVLFLTPPSNSKIDELRAKNPALQDQSVYAEAINYIGNEQGFEVIDLFNMNFLNSHDVTVRSTWMSDEVHPNSEGNKVLAQRVAAEIIKRYQMP